MYIYIFIYIYLYKNMYICVYIYICKHPFPRLSLTFQRECNSKMSKYRVKIT